MIQLKTFGRARIDFLFDNQKRRSLQLHNEKVRENREVMCRLIDAVYLLGKQELSFWGHDESESSLNKGNYIEFLKLLERYDDVLRRHFSEATVFVGTSPQVQYDLIHCMSRVMKEEICDELSGANFVAIELDESPDVSKRDQLSLVFRYVSKFRVCERFIEFIECSLEINAE